MLGSSGTRNPKRVLDSLRRPTSPSPAHKTSFKDSRLQDFGFRVWGLGFIRFRVYKGLRFRVSTEWVSGCTTVLSGASGFIGLSGCRVKGRRTMQDLELYESLGFRV